MLTPKSRMRLPLRLVALPALGATLLLIAACGSDGPTGAAPGARLSVYLKDAPGDVVRAVVTIDQIYLQGGDSGRLVLRDEDYTVDLLTLADSVAGLVDGTAVPAGSYAGLHLVVSGGYLEVEEADGTTAIYASSTSYDGLPIGAVVAGTLTMPSFAQSGLKVQFSGDLAVGEGEQHLLVDFDVEQSFGRPAGQSGTWVMTPVITGETLSAPPTE